MKLLFILFNPQLYTQITIFKYIKEKYGKEMIKIVRKIEKHRVKITKVKCDIRFLSYCNNKILAPIFIRPKLAIR